MKHRQIINLLCIALPVCVLLRTIQINFTIDNTTGFIKQNYSDICVLISLVIFAATATMCVLSYFTENIVRNESDSQPVVAFSCILTGIMYVYEAFACLPNLNTTYSISLLLLCFISAIVFIAYGVSRILPYKFPAFSLIVPTVYYIVKLIKLFVSTSALSLVTENIFLLFANSALLWFLFEFARFENNIGELQKMPKNIFACAITASLLCVVTALPKLFLLSVQATSNPHADFASALLMIAQTVFILAYTISNFCPKQPRVQKFTPKHS